MAFTRKIKNSQNEPDPKDDIRKEHSSKGAQKDEKENTLSEFVSKREGDANANVYYYRQSSRPSNGYGFNTGFMTNNYIGFQVMPRLEELSPTKPEVEPEEKTSATKQERKEKDTSWHEKLEEIYTTSMPISEMSEILGVSESSIRKYMRDNDWDRSGDNKKLKVKKIKDYKRDHPEQENASKKIAAQLGMSYNTLRKYWEENDEEILGKAGKKSLFKDDVQDFQRPGTDVMDSEVEILKDIAKNFLTDNRFDADLTYGIGRFYRVAGSKTDLLDEPVHKFDKYPEEDRGVKPLEDLEDNTAGIGKISSAFVDPPVELKEGMTSDMISNIPCSLMITADKYMSEGAILVVKATDCYVNSKSVMVSGAVLEKAFSLGYDLVESYVLVGRPVTLRVGELRSRNYSNYFVFRKSVPDPSEEDAFERDFR